MKIKELRDLVVFSVKSILKDMTEWLEELKSPRTWSSILIVAFFIGMYTKRFDIMVWALIFIFIIYIMRQKIDGEYRKEKFEKDILNLKDSYIVEEYYQEYKKKIFNINNTLNRDEVPMTFEMWKKTELERITKKRNKLEP